MSADRTGVGRARKAGQRKWAGGPSRRSNAAGVVDPKRGALNLAGKPCEAGQGQETVEGSPEAQRIKELEREVRELQRANEILRKASAYFAQAELDRLPG